METITLESIRAVKQDLENEQPSPEDWFFVYAQARIQYEGNKGDGKLAAIIPTLERLAKPFIDGQKAKWEQPMPIVAPDTKVMRRIDYIALQMSRGI